MGAMETKEYLTLNEVAELLSVNPETVRRWSNDGSIPAAKVGGIWRYRKVDIDRLFEKNGDE